MLFTIHNESRVTNKNAENFDKDSNFDICTFKKRRLLSFHIEFLICINNVFLLFVPISISQHMQLQLKACDFIYQNDIVGTSRLSGSATFNKILLFRC